MNSGGYTKEAKEVDWFFIPLNPEPSFLSLPKKTAEDQPGQMFSQAKCLQVELSPLNEVRSQ